MAQTAILSRPVAHSLTASPLRNAIAPSPSSLALPRRQLPLAILGNSIKKTGVTAKLPSKVRLSPRPILVLDSPHFPVPLYGGLVLVLTPMEPGLSVF